MMVLWQGDTVGTRVRWLWAKPTARVLPFASQMYSSVWDDPYTYRTVGEQGVIHRWSNGVNAVAGPGTIPCGPIDAWQQGGIHGIDREIEVDAMGCCDCCGDLCGDAELSSGGSFKVEASLSNNVNVNLESGGQCNVSLEASLSEQIKPTSGGSISTIIGAFIGESVAVTGGGVISLSASGPPSVSVAVALTGGGRVDEEESEDVPIIGEVKWLAFDSVPSGWLSCDGSSFDPATYPDLYSAIGHTWGTETPSGDPLLPDLRRRSIIGDGGTASFGPANSIGSVGGEEGHVLTSPNEIPAHAHSVTASAGSGAAFVVTNGAVTAGTGVNWFSGTGSTPFTDPMGNGGAHNTYHPVAVMRPIIYAGV